MKVEQLKEGQELLVIIDKTEKALIKLRGITQRERKEERVYDDKLYNLSIGEYSDSKNNADLARYDGNVALLKVITDELERQLSDFKSRFEEL